MTRPRRILSLLVPTLALLALLIAAPAAPASKYVSVKGAPAPGPKRYDKVFIDKHGPKRAKTVLVLIPGTGGGTGSVAPVAHDLAKRIDGLQVWAGAG